MPLTEEEREIARQIMREQLASAQAKMTTERRREIGRQSTEGRDMSAVARKGGSRKTEKKTAALREVARRRLEKDPDAFRKMGALGAAAGGRKGGTSHSAKKVAAARANLARANEVKKLKARKPPTPTTQRPKFPPRMPLPPTAIDVPDI